MRDIRRRINAIEQKMNIGRHKKIQNRYLYFSKKRWQEDGCPRDCVILGKKKRLKATKNNQFPES